MSGREFRRLFPLFLSFFVLTVPRSVWAEETAQEKYLVVTVPAADLSKTPQSPASGYGHDDVRLTQVIFNEVLRYESGEGDWVRVEAVEQKKVLGADPRRWRGYDGYVRKDAVRAVDQVPQYDFVVREKMAHVFDRPSSSGNVLFRVSMGTRFRSLGRQNGFMKVDLGGGRCGWVADGLKRDLVETAMLFLRTPYLWGGRSFAGVDCSGLVNLVYRARSIDIPRDAQEQWLASEKISSDALRPADLIFLSAKGRFDAIVHVMLFVGGEDFIEAPGTGQEVRRCTFKDKFGFTLDELRRRHFMVRGRKVLFGRVPRENV